MINILYQDDHIEVLQDLRPSNIVLVTFGDMHSRADSTTYWGQALTQKLGFAGIGIMPRQSNWYPSDSMGKACAIIKQTVNSYRSVITYGNSMGGYGAAKYGALLGAHITLSVCPQYSINQNDLPFPDWRYQTFFQPALHENMAIRGVDLANKCYIIFDRLHRLDNLNALEINPGSPHIYEINVPSMGHNVIRSIASSATLGEIIENAIHDRPHEVRRIFRDARLHYKGRLYSFACVAAERRPNVAWNIVNKYFDRFPAVQVVKICEYAAVYHANRKEFERAGAFVACALRKAPGAEQILKLNEHFQISSHTNGS